jgi:hypothetical protein
VKVFALSWSEKVLATGGATPSTSPLSLVTPVTLSKDPTAEDMEPVTWAEKSLPLPTLSDRGPRAGGYGAGGAVVHGTDCHWVFGYVALKHPFFGIGARDIDARQASWLMDGAGDGCAVAGGGGSCAHVARLDKSPESRLATITIRPTVVRRILPPGAGVTVGVTLWLNA